MRTKTLLLGVAAALAVSLATSQAQVYSANVVGYANISVGANSFWPIVGNQLVNGSDVNSTNGNINAVLANGMISSPNNPGTSSNTVMLYWTGGSFAQYYFYNSNDASTQNGDSPGTDPAGWYLANGTYQTKQLQNGQSCFIHNVFSAPITVTLVGTVFQGTNISTINTGFNMIGLQEPLATNTVVGSAAYNAFAPYGLPATMTSSPTPSTANNDYMLFWTGGSYAQYYYLNATDASTFNGDSPGTDYAGFYLANGNPGQTPAVGEGFFIHHIGSGITWTNSYTVQ
jgi:hypothetical protein